MIRFNILALSYLFPNREYPTHGVFVLNRLKAIQQYHNVEVIAPVPWFPFMARSPKHRGFTRVPRRERIQEIDVRHPRFPVIPRYMKWIDGFSYFFATLPFAKKAAQCDLIDVHWVYPDIVAGYLLAKRYKKPFLVTVRGPEALHPGEKSIRKRILDALLPKADHVIALSRELKEAAVAIGADPERTTVVLNGVDGKTFPKLDRMTCRERLGLSPTKKIIISVGSLIKRKGHHRIVACMPALSKRHDVEYRILGGVNPEGDDSEMIRKMIAERNLDNVHLQGKVPHDELLYWYNAADLFCLASASEGCPNVLMEALSCGTPVVAHDVGAVRQVVNADAMGYVVEMGDGDALQVALDRALQGEWDRDAICEVMRRRSWDACAREAVSIYEKILGESR